MVIVNKTLIDMLPAIGQILKMDQEVLSIRMDDRQGCLNQIEAKIKGYGPYDPCPVLRAVENIFDHATPIDLATAFIFDRFHGEKGLICMLLDAGEGFDFRGVEKSGDYGDGFKEYTQPEFEVSFEGNGNTINVLYRKEV